MKVIDEWKNLTLSQFYDKPVLWGIIRAISEIYQDAYAEQQELRKLLDIDSQEGVNLDHIGDILCLTRTQAHQILRRNNEFELTDELYRKALKYKIILNNSNATYYDIMEGIGIIWNTGDVVYRENENHPATYILDLKSYDINSGDILESRTMTIKAAGVKVLFIIVWLIRFQYRFWRCGARVTYHNVVQFFKENVRKFDGSWKLDGTYHLDALSTKPLRVTYRCLPFPVPLGMKLKNVHDLPDRLIVRIGDDGTYLADEPAITGAKGYGIEALPDGDSLKITSSGGPEVQDQLKGLKVTGQQERTVYAKDYIVSPQEAYGEYETDGLRIYFAAALEFSIEIAPTMV